VDVEERQLSLSPKWPCLAEWCYAIQP
jgi:hypothetical protein